MFKKLKIEESVPAEFETLVAGVDQDDFGPGRFFTASGSCCSVAVGLIALVPNEAGAIEPNGLDVLRRTAPPLRHCWNWTPVAVATRT